MFETICPWSERQTAVQVFVFRAAILVSTRRLHCRHALNSPGAAPFLANKPALRDTHDTVTTPDRNLRNVTEKFLTSRSHPVHEFRDLKRRLVISY